MGRLMFNGKCYSSKEAALMLNRVNYSYSLLQDRYILDPNALDIIGSASGYSGAFPVGYIEAHQSSGYSVGARNNEYVLSFSANGNKIIGFTEKISKKCKTIEVEAEVEGYSGQWQMADIRICGSPVPVNYYTPTDPKETLYFAYIGETASWINSQDYISFETPVTSSNAMARQKVTIDVESMGLTDDFYIVLHNCDSYFYVRSIKVLF